MYQARICGRWGLVAMVVDDVGSDSRSNYGSLISRMTLILTHRQFLTHGLNGRDVFMRISEYVKESELSTDLARMIIPAIKVAVNQNRKSSNVEDKLIYLSALANLVQNAINPPDFIE